MNCQGDRAQFHEGDLALLLDAKEHTYLVSLRPGRTFHSNLGFIRHEAIIGAREGSIIRTNKDAPFLLLRPLVADYLMKMPRHTNILYPKDLGYLLFHSGIGPGSVVVEGGSGSGGGAIALLAAVGPTGHVTTYEVREEFAARALRNIESFFPDTSNLTVRVGDLYDGIEERGIDAVVLDVPEPWRVVAHAAEALRMGGAYAAYIPTTLQLQETVEALRRDRRFQRIDAVEVMVRHWEASGRSVRPAHRMIGHTGFLVLARRCEPAPWEAAASAEPEPDASD
jgi:tRNA (adenine57-N1/adenine58-N1)-methyltransferase